MLGREHVWSVFRSAPLLLLIRILLVCSQQSRSHLIVDVNKAEQRLSRSISRTTGVAPDILSDIGRRRNESSVGELVDTTWPRNEFSPLDSLLRYNMLSSVCCREARFTGIKNTAALYMQGTAVASWFDVCQTGGVECRLDILNRRSNTQTDTQADLRIIRIWWLYRTVILVEIFWNKNSNKKFTNTSVCTFSCKSSHMSK